MSEADKRVVGSSECTLSSALAAVPVSAAGGCTARTAIEPLFDAVCITEEAVPRLVDDELFEDELAHLAQSVPKRRAEFGTARVCARRALARLGHAPMSLVPHKDRAPRWPAGVVGSIAHTKDYCAVVVAHAERMRSVGLDVETDKPMSVDIAKRICNPRELAHLGVRVERDAVVYFSIKEALYKCLYPLTQTYMDFMDAELEVDFDAGLYRAQVFKPLPVQGAWLTQLGGAFIRERGIVMSGMSLRMG